MLPAIVDRRMLAVDKNAIGKNVIGKIAVGKNAIGKNDIGKYARQLKCHW